MTLASSLINAGSTIGEEDLATIQTLYEAGVPATVLLSKADLLTEQERESARVYITERIRVRLDLNLKVWPVSVVGDAAALSDRWFEEQIAPLYEQHQQLASESVRRKIAALRESVETALKVKTDQCCGTLSVHVKKLRQAEKELKADSRPDTRKNFGLS